MRFKMNFIGDSETMVRKMFMCLDCATMQFQQLIPKY